MNLLSVLALASCEKIINTALASDTLTQEQLANLAGKILRLKLASPALEMDVIFCDDHVRFEPVSQSPFEPQGGIITQPDCTVMAENLGHLMSLMKQQGGNLPILGDHRLLMQIAALAEQFEPQILDKLEAIIGRDLASHLYLLGQEVSPMIRPLGQMLKTTFADLSGRCQPASTSPIDDEIFEKKQELLRLQADIERQQAKLATLENQAKPRD